MNIEKLTKEEYERLWRNGGLSPGYKLVDGKILYSVRRSGVENSQFTATIGNWIKVVALEHDRPRAHWGAVVRYLNYDGEEAELRISLDELAEPKKLVKRFMAAGWMHGANATEYLSNYLSRCCAETKERRII